MLASFDASNARPLREPIFDNQGNMLGITQNGGAVGAGSIYKYSPSGTVATLAVFNGSNGALPGGFDRGADGNYYGMTVAYTGVSSPLFKLTPSS